MFNISSERKKYKKIIDFLKVKKPLVIFILETTGPSIPIDKIFEIAYIKILPNGRVIKDRFILNPEIDISEESMSIHGIKNKELKDRPTFRKMAKEIWDIFNNCYYGGYNILDFYLPLLRREFIRVGMDFEYNEKEVIDSKLIFDYMEPSTLSGAYRYYCQKEHLDIYNAMADVEVAINILARQLETYKSIIDLPFINNIHGPQEEKYIDHKKKFYWRNGEAYFTFSKYKDTPLAEVVKADPDFLGWILKADFSEETKNIIRKVLKKYSSNK
ncbi:MAG: exonuclease domain-containing protein [Patescibacteria group bacterium]